MKCLRRRNRKTIDHHAVVTRYRCALQQSFVGLTKEPHVQLTIVVQVQ